MRGPYASRLSHLSALLLLRAWNNTRLRSPFRHLCTNHTDRLVDCKSIRRIASGILRVSCGSRRVAVHYTQEQIRWRRRHIIHQQMPRASETRGISHALSCGFSAERIRLGLTFDMAHN
ncbi:hypothetical protein BC827DRAFT_504284 [Russula dissimulans]|nr:hypothetical protein BC827DRAFT_504284 [Russula dissimulans]